MDKREISEEYAQMAAEIIEERKGNASASSDSDEERSAVESETENEKESDGERVVVRKAIGNRSAPKGKSRTLNLRSRNVHKTAQQQQRDPYPAGSHPSGGGYWHPSRRG